MILLLFIILLLFVAPDVYLSLVTFRGAAWWVHLLIWVPVLVAVGTLFSVRIGGLTNVKTEVFIILLLCVAFPQLLFVLFSLIGKMVGLAWHPAAIIGNGVGAVSGVILLLSAIYGLTFGWKNLKVQQDELTFDNLPAAFEGYKIVQISDLHVGSYGKNPAFLEKVVQYVNAEQPDLIVFTGDIVNTSSEEITPFESVLSKLQAKDGVVAVLGNHDYCMYGMGDHPADLREGALPVVAAERRMGWDILLNEHRLISRDGSQIAIIGVEHTGKPPFPQIGDLRGAMKGLPDSTFKILLSHDPSHWRREVLPDTDIPLMLAGHTHAAQLKIGSWSPVQWMYKEWSGLYVEDNQQLFVSEGVGGTIPFRFGTSPKIIVHTLRHR